MGDPVAALSKPFARWRQLQQLRREFAPAARRHADDFASVQAFCLFVGSPRSGHSLIGSLLDAHPDVVISHELDCVRYFKYRFPRDVIFEMIRDNARRYGEEGRRQSGYEYIVPGQWQGRARTIRVIGDKRGGTTIRRLRGSRFLLGHLRRTLGVPLRIVHAIRNPFDNIATIFRRSERSLPQAIEHYFGMEAGCDRLRKRVAEGEWLALRHDDFVADPARELIALCDFLGVEIEDDYLRDCAGIVWKSSNQTRHQVDWPAGTIDEIQARADAIPHLAHFRFDDGEPPPSPTEEQ